MNWMPLDMASRPVSATMPFIEAVSKCSSACPERRRCGATSAGTRSARPCMGDDQADAHRDRQQDKDAD